MNFIKKHISGEGIALSVILAAAFWLRFHNLGALGLYGDEDYTYLAVKGVLDTGFPTMPSGELYVRGMIFTYLAALSAKAFGLSEFSLRLPNVIFAVQIILVLYFFTKEILGKTPALVVAFLYSVSVWDIEMSRFARMYEIFLLFYVTSAYTFYRGFVKGERRFMVLTPLLFFLTTTIHLLGIFLLLFFITPFLMKDYGKVRLRWTALAAGITGLASFTYYWFESNFYKTLISAELLAKSTSQSLNRPLPDLSLVSDLFSHLHWANVLFGSMLAALCTVFVFRMMKFIKERPYTITHLLTISVILVAVILQQYGILLWVLALALYKTHKGFKGLHDRLHVTYALFISASFVIWFAWGFYDQTVLRGIGAGLPAVKAVLLALMDYPFIHMRKFLNVMPIMTIIVLAGLALLYDRSSRGTVRPGAIVVIVGLLGPLVAIGFIREWFYLQYLYMAYPFFLIIFAWLVAELAEYLLRAVTSLTNRRRIYKLTVVSTFMVLALALSNLHSPNQAASISKRGYGTPVKDLEIFEYTTHPDHKNAAQFVKTNMVPGDMVIVMDIISMAYLDKVDFLLRSEGVFVEGLQLKHEVFVGCPIIHDLKTLEATLRSRPGASVWLITSHELMGPHLRKPIMSAEITTFLEENSDKVAYTAEDGVTRIYMWRS